MQTEPTPGEWQGWYNQAQTPAQPRGTGFIVGLPFVNNKDEFGFTNPADVFLMAASKKLLAACIAARDDALIYHFSEYQSIYEQLDAAIKDAQIPQPNKNPTPAPKV